METALPKNIRQIGDIRGSEKICLEDYVMTYIRKKEQQEEQGYLGIFLGEQQMAEDAVYVYIRGIYEIPMKEPEEGTLGEAVLTECSKYFPDWEVQGCCVIGTYPASRMEKLAEQIPQSGQILYHLQDQEETLYWMHEGQYKRINGYFVFYEQNRKMQEYMAEIFAENSVEKESLPDKAIKSFREKIKEKGLQKTNSMLKLAGSFFVVTVLVIGAIAVNRVQDLRTIRNAAGDNTVENEAAQDELRLVNGALMQDGTQMQSGTQVQNESLLQSGAQIQDGTQMQNESLLQSGTLIQSGAQIQDGALIQNGTQTQEGLTLAPQANALIQSNDEGIQDAAQSSSTAANAISSSASSATGGAANVISDSSTALSADGAGASSNGTSSTDGAADAISSSASSASDETADVLSDNSIPSTAATADAAQDSSTQQAAADTSEELAGPSSFWEEEPEDSAASEEEAQEAASMRQIQAAYTIREGDTLADICNRYYGGLDKLSAICEANGIQDANLIMPGQKIVLP